MIRWAAVTLALCVAVPEARAADLTCRAATARVDRARSALVTAERSVRRAHGTVAKRKAKQRTTKAKRTLRTAKAQRARACATPTGVLPAAPQPPTAPAVPSPGAGGPSPAPAVPAANHAPAAAAVPAALDEDGSLAITLAAGDPDGDALTFTISSLPGHGRLISGGGEITDVPTTLTSATVTYRPVADFNGADSFTYTARDPGGAQSAPAAVSLTVRAVNDAPSAGAVTQTTDEDTAVAITLTGSDPDGDALGFALTALPVHGRVYRGDSTAPSDEINAV